MLRDGQPHARSVRAAVVTATLDGAVIARSAQTILFEGNHYFPPRDVSLSMLTPSAIRSCFTITTERKCRFLQARQSTSPVSTASPDR